MSEKELIDLLDNYASIKTWRNSPSKKERVDSIIEEIMSHMKK